MVRWNVAGWPGIGFQPIGVTSGRGGTDAATTLAASVRLALLRCPQDFE